MNGWEFLVVVTCSSLLELILGWFLKILLRNKSVSKLALKSFIILSLESQTHDHLIFLRKTFTDVSLLFIFFSLFIKEPDDRDLNASEILCARAWSSPVARFVQNSSGKDCDFTLPAKWHDCHFETEFFYADHRTRFSYNIPLSFAAVTNHLPKFTFASVLGTVSAMIAFLINVCPNTIHLGKLCPGTLWAHKIQLSLWKAVNWNKQLVVSTPKYIAS